MLVLFPKVPKKWRPKALKIDVFDCPLSFDASSPRNPNEYLYGSALRKNRTRDLLAGRYIGLREYGMWTIVLRDIYQKIIQRFCERKKMVALRCVWLEISVFAHDGSI